MLLKIGPDDLLEVDLWGGELILPFVVAPTCVAASLTWEVT
jgi:hypothetical protein